MSLTICTKTVYLEDRPGKQVIVSDNRGNRITTPYVPDFGMKDNHTAAVDAFVAWLRLPCFPQADGYWGDNGMYWVCDAD